METTARKCLHCAKPFCTQTPARVYCSTTCKDRAFDKRGAENKRVAVHEAPPFNWGAVWKIPGHDIDRIHRVRG